MGRWPSEDVARFSLRARTAAPSETLVRGSSRAPIIGIWCAGAAPCAHQLSWSQRHTHPPAPRNVHAAPPAPHRRCAAGVAPPGHRDHHGHHVTTIPGTAAFAAISMAVPASHTRRRQPRRRCRTGVDGRGMAPLPARGPTRLAPWQRIPHSSAGVCRDASCAPRGVVDRSWHAGANEEGTGRAGRQAAGGAVAATTGPGRGHGRDPKATSSSARRQQACKSAAV